MGNPMTSAMAAWIRRDRIFPMMVCDTQLAETWMRSAREADVTPFIRNFALISSRKNEIGENGISAEFLAQAATLGIDVQYVLVGVRSANTSDVEKKVSEASVAVKGDNAGGMICGNVVGIDIVHSGATVNQITMERHVERTIAKVEPSDEHISDEQAASLKELVEQVVTTEQKLKQTPKGQRTVWSALNAHCGVPSYRLIKLEDFAKAQKYLHQWLGRLSSMATAPVKDGDAWRKRKYAYIKINSKNDPDIVDRYIARNFQASSLSDLSNDELEQVYRDVASKKRTSPKSVAQQFNAPIIGGNFAGRDINIGKEKT
jgi:hypothetical protein